MICPSCEHESPEGARFCMHCATPFALACPSCAAELPAGARFCPQCAAPVEDTAPSVAEREPRSYTPKHLADKILQSKSALEGERKQVTVLFADVKESMELAQQVDAEQWHRILNRFFEILTEGVHRFEGTVNQYTGDGIMALFGAPISHEDHAHRACYAALTLSEELRSYAIELRRSQGFNFSVRMGLNSGEVIVGKIGDDLRMDYTAQGHTVGLAARMEQLAEPGSVYATNHTATLVSGYFELEDLGEFSLQGATEPIRVHELQGVGHMRTRLDASRARGLSKFVGRVDEMTGLEAALQRAKQGQAQAVGVVGEAGVGKSRLCAEFLERCRAEGVTTFETHGLAHGKAVPFLPMLDLFRAFFGIRSQDGDTSAREKIAGRLLLLDEGFRDSLPLVFDFLGVPDPDNPAPTLDPEARQSQLLAAVRAIIEARGKRETTVALLEDLHWFDPGSEAFLAQLVEALAATRALMILNFRPEYQAPWMQLSYYQRLPVVPLGVEAIQELLHHLLGEDPSVAPLYDLIHERTAGNPFFTEEVVQSLAESGSLEGTRGAYRLVKLVGELSVPQTVQSVLAARIDRLPEREKKVLQTAAVIGKKFSEPILHKVIELPDVDLAGALSQLQALEFIFAEALYPEAEYAFKHPLTQEVSYQSQLSEQREGVHAAVAGALEETPEDGLDEQAALIAHHWEGAGLSLRAARWHQRAAVWSGMAHLEESIRHWRRVHELLLPLEETPEVAELGAEAAGRLLRESAREGSVLEDEAAILERGRALAEKGESPRAKITFLYGVASQHVFNGRLTEGIPVYLEARRLAAEIGDDDLLVATNSYLDIAHLLSARLDDARDFVDESLELLEKDRSLGRALVGYSPLATKHAYAAAIEGLRGGLATAEAMMARADQAARADDDPAAQLLVDFWGSWMENLRGDVPAALARARSAVAGCDKAPVRAMIGTSHFVLAQSLVAAGEFERALETAEYGREMGIGISRLFIHSELALACLGCGQNERARTEADGAVAGAVRGGAVTIEVLARLARAEILLRLDGPPARSRVQEELDRVERLVEEHELLTLRPQTCELRAELAAATGNEASQLEQLREAKRLYEEVGASGHAQRLAQDALLS